MRSADSPQCSASTIIGAMETSHPACLAAVARRLAASAAIVAVAFAAAGARAEPGDHRHALGAKLGTTGLGLEYSYALGELPQYGLRATVNFGTYTRSETRRGIAFDGAIEFSTLMLLADAHPYRNGFRLSAGLMVNRNRLKADGRPAAATVTINDVTYPADAVERASGEVRFQWPSPYFGLGWGAAPGGAAGPFYSFDLGLAYQRPDITLHVVCGPSLPAAECARLQADTRAQEGKFREDAVGYRLYPILTFGAGYKF